MGAIPWERFPRKVTHKTKKSVCGFPGFGNEAVFGLQPNKNIFSKPKGKTIMTKSIRNLTTRAYLKAQSLKSSAKAALNNENGDFYISEGVKVIIAVILGSLLITAMVALFNSQIIPGIQDKITELFGAYSGPTITDPTVGGYN